MFGHIKNQSVINQHQQDNAQKLEAKIDYIAMMSDIEIETDEQEETDDEQ